MTTDICFQCGKKRQTRDGYCKYCTWILAQEAKLNRRSSNRTIPLFRSRLGVSLLSSLEFEMAWKREGR